MKKRELQLRIRRSIISFLKLFMHVSLCLAITNSYIALLLDFRIERVECLRSPVVKHSWSSVVLTGNSHNGSHFLRINESLAVFSSHLRLETRSISESFFSSLLIVPLSFKREWDRRLIARLVTPVSSIGFSFLLLLLFTLAIEPVSKGHTSTQVVPINVSVDWDESNKAPQHPTTLTNHPDIGLAHVVRHVEHHFNYYL